MRSEFPVLPVEMPKQLEGASVEEMGQWLLDYNGACAFNVCEHQPLQKITGPPLKIRVKEGAEPVALH